MTLPATASLAEGVEVAMPTLPAGLSRISPAPPEEIVKAPFALMSSVSMVMAPQKVPVAA